MARLIPRLVLEVAPIAMLAGAGVLALRGAGPAHRPGRGRMASSPLRIPLKGWKEILVRTYREFAEDQISLIAAGVSFYTLLAIFPGLAAFVALYGLFSDVAQAQHDLQVLAVILPASAVTFFGDQMIRLAQTQTSGLSLAFVIGLLTSIWSANGAVTALMTGLNIAHEQHETRSFLRRTMISLAFTLGMLVFGLATVAVLGAGPAVEVYVGHHAALWLDLISWPLLLVAMSVGLALLYRFGPSHRSARFAWITPGGAAALVLWLAVSALFSLYVGAFAHYDKTYGSLGAVVGFMMWNWLSDLIILAGAELNSEIERQTSGSSA